MSKTIPGSKAYACDVTDSKTVAATFSAIQEDLGDVDVDLSDGRDALRSRGAQQVG